MGELFPLFSDPYTPADNSAFGIAGQIAMGVVWLGWLAYVVYTQNSELQAAHVAHMIERYGLRQDGNYGHWLAARWRCDY